MADAVRMSGPFRLSVATILLCGAATAVFVYFDRRRAEENHARTEFTRHAALRHAVTREALGRDEEALFGLASALTLDPEINQEEFRRAARKVAPRISGALAFEWVPVVRREERPAFERAMRQLYPSRGFEFIDFDPAGHARPAPVRDVYYPVTFIEPLRGNEIALGFDLSAGPTHAFLERARQSGRMIVTSAVKFVQGNPGQHGIVMLWPVHGDTPTPATAAASDHFRGFVQCLFEVQTLLRSATDSQSDAGLDMLFVDHAATAADERVLYYRPGLAGGDAVVPSESQFRGAAPFVLEYDLPIGERDWRVLYRPQATWLAAQRSNGPVLRSGTVLVLAGLLAGLVVVIGRRTAVIHREVDERTAELAESRRQYSQLLHALPGMAYRGRFDGRFQLAFASEGTLALTGWTAEDFLSGTVHMRDVIHPADVERVRTATLHALKTGHEIEVEYRIVTRDGAEKWILSRAHVVPGQGPDDRQLEGLAIDITARKQEEASRLALERKLLDTQKLESLGLLAGGVAHDFNNLLSAILGNANLARMSLPVGHPVDPQLKAIESASIRAADLCRQMLAYAGKGRFVVEHVDLSALAQEMLPLLRVSIPTSASFVTDFAAELPAIRADATQIRQMLMNLVLNAVDALGGKTGSIVVQTGVAELDPATLARCLVGAQVPAGPYVFIEVADTGCGMTPEVMSRIFDPFFTTKSAGRGLGLAAVLGIVRGHNGALLVETIVGHGSTFRLFLPVAHLGAVVPPAPSPSAPPHVNIRYSGDVLVIDDEEPVRVVLVSIMRAFGFNPHSASSGRDGIAQFRQNPLRWKVVVIDLLMPGLSGEETLAELQAISPGVRALLVSGFAEPEALSRYSAGGNHVRFLAKPFRYETLEKMLRELMA